VTRCASKRGKKGEKTGNGTIQGKMDPGASSINKQFVGQKIEKVIGEKLYERETTVEP